MNKENLLDNLKDMKEEDVIEGVEEKSLDKIIKEVAEEEGLTEEEVVEMVKKLGNFKFKLAPKGTKKKKSKEKTKKKEKMAKKSKKKNRKK